jgi:hypothetical protein
MSQNVIDIVAPPTPEPSGDARDARVLAGWLQAEEAISAVLGRPAVSPSEAASAMARYVACRNAVASRPLVEPKSPIVAGDRALLDAVARRADVQAAFAPHPIRVEWVDLSRVISIQKLVFIDGLDERVASAAVSEAELVALCLPGNASQPAKVGIAQDVDGRGFTFSSPNPNLRLQAAQVTDGGQVAFIVGISSPFLSVASYQGRYYLNDGNHRAAGLIKRGVTTVPAVVFEAPSFGILGGVAAPLFGHDVFTATVPPLVTDFWDDSVAIESSRPKTLKGLRVRAEEFTILL